MYSLFWTEQAKQETENIYDFIAEDSVRYAETVCAEIIENILQIQSFAKIGRIVPEYNDEAIREIFYKNYRIIYE